MNRTTNPHRLVGQRIQQLRVRRGLTRGQFAPAVGYTADGLKNIELGRRGLSTENLTRFADALGVNPTVLIEGEPHAAIDPPQDIARESRSWKRQDDWEVYDTLPITCRRSDPPHDAVLVVYRFGQAEVICPLCDQRWAIADAR